MREFLSLTPKAKRNLKVYGLGSFTAATGLAAYASLFAAPILPATGAVALIGGSAFVLGWFARERRQPRQPTLVFVSTGGTCRDPMAKVIMERLVAGRTPPIRILATALRPPLSRGATKAARYTVKQATGADLLRHHRPLLLDEKVVAEADLILTMGEEHAREIRKNFPDHRSRIRSLLEFVGQAGDIDDPWHAPDEMDDDTLARYRSCYLRLEDVLTRNADKIYSAVIA